MPTHKKLWSCSRKAVGQLITLALQVLVHAREFPQLDYHWIVETHAPKTVSIGAQRVPEYESIAPVILGAGNAVAVAEAIELFGVDGEDLEAPSTRVSTTAPRGISIATATPPGSSPASSFSSVPRPGLPLIGPQSFCAAAR